uniref:Reverse transcriptase zinc-binding domain-containing protein n=1 Tax=Brassica oleracea TaxID=3712 RepID=A0A3P6E8V8_BRAOL|nr:unnamed protein product [Brassica oleracea]
MNPRDEELRVPHLIDLESQTWNLDLLNQMIATEDIPHITSIRLSKTGRYDCYSWDFTKSGLYSVKSGYSIARHIHTNVHSTLVSEPSTIGLKKIIWKIQAPRKLKHFLWQATAGYLATAEKLKERHCAQASTFWALSLIPISPGCFPCTSLYANIDYLLLRIKDQGIHADVMGSIPWLLWYIWKARNEKIFANKDGNASRHLTDRGQRSGKLETGTTNPRKLGRPTGRGIADRSTDAATDPLLPTLELSNRRIMDKQRRESRHGFCGDECRNHDAIWSQRIDKHDLPTTRRS